MTHPGVVVSVGAGGAAELRARTVASLRAHTSDEVPVMELEDPLLAAPTPSDVVLVEPGCLVAEGWLAGLRDAAHAASTIATATALTQRDLGEWAGDGQGALEPAAAAVRAASPRMRPRIPPGPGACVYVRRTAIELVGGEPGFERRCLERGLSHVLADDVLVLDSRPAPRAAAPRGGPDSEPLTRALGAARRALRGLSVAIDARILTGTTTGTQVHVLEVIAGLARLGRLQLTVVVPNQPNPEAIARLEAIPGVALVTYEQASRGLDTPADVVHRPFQLSNAGDLNFLASLGERLVLTQQDLIAYHNPAYFSSRADWEAHRQLTRLALAVADRVLFFSAHARDDALAEDLVAPARTGVVHLGVDHRVAPADPDRGRASTLPVGAERLSPAAQVILCLGTDYHHKNRVFALRLVASLRRGHDYSGVLVLAGPAVAHGSSRAQEAELVASHPELAGAVLDVGPVTEAEKDWLFDRAALVVYPSVVEGFGLVPFEAAAHRVPCLWAPGSSLSELLPDEAAGIVPWDEEQTARRARALLGDEGAREDNLKAIDRAAAALTWDATAAGLLEAYQATADAPAVSPARAAAAGELGLLTEDAARLVGPGGELPLEVHRPLLALATHRRIARPVFGALKLGYRISYDLRRRRSQRRR